MAIIKLSKSKRQVQVIDEEGNMFVTSTNYMLGLLNGKAPTGFILLSRLPVPVAKDRFKPSPLYDPEGLYNEKTVGLSNDGLNATRIKDKEKKEAMEDKLVW